MNTLLKTRFIAALKLSLILGAGLLMAACKSPKATSENADFGGVYTLVSVNGKQLPASVSHNGAALQVRSGAFTINMDGTCGANTVFVPPSGAEVARETSATYTKDGSRLTMQWKGAGRTIGTVEGKTFTMDNEGMIFVYRK